MKVIETHTMQNVKSKEIKSEAGKALQPKVGKEKRLMSKSAQKYRTRAVHPEKVDECETCKKAK